MIVKGVETGNLAVPFHHVSPPIHIGFVVFPDADNRRSQVHYFRIGVLVFQAGLSSPCMNGKVAILLVKPIPIENCEMNVVRHLLVQGIIDRHGWPHAALPGLIDARNELELEIEKSLRIVLFVDKVLRPRQRLEGST